MKPLTIVSAILIMATALTLALVIAMKTPYLSGFLNKNDGNKMCAQVITRAIDPNSGEVQEYNTPCDVPEGWEIVPVQNDIAGIVEEGGNAIFVFDQQPSNIVKVQGAQLKSAGFVVIHTNEDDEAGEIIAYSNLLPEGLSNDIQIELPNAGLDGTTYVASLYQDDGDGVFDVETDSPLKDSLGNPIQGIFQMSESATEPGAVSF